MTEKTNELQTILQEMKLDETIFTEDVMSKIKLVIESKVNDKLAEEKEKLEEDNKKELAEFKEYLVNQLDEYMNYFVENFTKENEKDIIDTVKIKTAERVLENFNSMVNEFNISLSEKSIDYSSDIDDMKSELNRVVNENIEMKKELTESNKYALILDRVMKMKVDSEKSRFSKLAESFDFDDEDSFKEKLNTLQESLEIKEDVEIIEEQETQSTKDTILTEDVTISAAKKNYLKVLHRTA